MPVFELFNQLPRKHLIGIIGLTFAIIVLSFWQTNKPTISMDLEVPRLAIEPLESTEHFLKSTQHKIQPGENLSIIFDKASIGPNVLYQIVKDNSRNKILKAIQPGETIEFQQDSDGVLLTLNYIRSPQLTEQFTLTGEDVIHTSIIRQPEYRTRFASGQIDSSLFLAGNAAGMTDALTMELAQMFGWDIDFALDIRKGDKFSLIYQEKFLDGSLIGYGAILAARFTNNGRTFNSIRFTDSEGTSDFYSPDGKSMRKAFLRTPVEFARISSHFSLGRKHPVLNTIRNHRGTDYAAPKGTAIRAAGDGKITTAGRKGGFGNAIIIQHGQRYSTLYAHLSAYNKSTKVGRQVKQGQIIGYVGSTGLATGPHLHYEFRVNGVAVNPVTVKLPSATPISEIHKDEFIEHAENMIGQLNAYEKSGFAPPD